MFRGTGRVGGGEQDKNIISNAVLHVTGFRRDSGPTEGGQCFHVV